MRGGNCDPRFAPSIDSNLASPSFRLPANESNPISMLLLWLTLLNKSINIANK